MSSNEIENINNKKFEFLLKRAEYSLEEEHRELVDIKSDNSLPTFETLSTIICLLSTVYLGYIFSDFYIFWIFSSFLLYSLIILFPLFNPNRKSRLILKKNDFKKIQKKLEVISGNQDYKTIFVLFFDWFFIIGEPLGMAYSIIFLSNIIMSAYIFYFGIIYLSYSLISSIIISILLFLAFFGVSLLSPYKLVCANSILNFDKPINKSKKLGFIGTLLIIILAIIMILVGLVVVCSSFFLTYWLFIDYRELIVNSWSIVGLTFLIQLGIFNFLQGRFTRRMVIKWKNNKIHALKTEVIYPVEHYIISNIEENNPVEQLSFKETYKRYWMLNLFVYRKMSFHKFFVKHLLVPNFQIIRSEDDMNSLREYLKVENEFEIHD